MTKARDLANFNPTNITDTGTEGTRVATGTTAQRGSTAGQLRFNSTTGLAEYYTGTAFKSIDSPPVVSSLDVTEVDSNAGGNQTIVITGDNFQSGATVTFVGASGTDFNASTVTVDSVTQITVVAPKASFLNAQEPYGVKVQNVSGLSTTLASQINVDTSPSWSTASGTLATITDTDTGTHATVSATDSDGDTIVYSETTSVLSGAGFSLNSSTGAITGDPTDVSASTTNTFTLRATANTKTVDRIFNIIVNKDINGLEAGRAFTSLSSASSLVPNSDDVAVRYFRNEADTASYLLPIKNVSGTVNWLMPIGSTSYTESTRTVSGSTYWFDSSYYTDQNFGSGALAWTTSGTTLTSNGGTDGGTNVQQVVRKINLGINFGHYSLDSFSANGYGSAQPDWANYTDPPGATMALGDYSDSVGIIVGKSGSYINGNPFTISNDTVGNRVASKAEEDLGYTDGTELALYASGDKDQEYYAINSGTILFRP